MRCDCVRRSFDKDRHGEAPCFWVATFSRLSFGLSRARVTMELPGGDLHDAIIDSSNIQLPTRGSEPGNARRSLWLYACKALATEAARAAAEVTTTPSRTLSRSTR
jgi:hypothetical protein